MENTENDRIDDRDDIRGTSVEMADYMISRHPDLVEMFGNRQEFVEMVDDVIDGDNQSLIIELCAVSDGFRDNHEKCMEWLEIMEPDEDILNDLVDPDLTGFNEKLT